MCPQAPEPRSFNLVPPHLILLPRGFMGFSCPLILTLQDPHPLSCPHSPLSQTISEDGVRGRVGEGHQNSLEPLGTLNTHFPG